MNIKDELKELLRNDAVRVGEFVLRSGKKSDFYIDCRPVLLTGYAQLLTGTIFDAVLAEEFGEDFTLVCAGIGSSVIATASCTVRPFHETSMMFVRDSKKAHGTGRKIEVPCSSKGPKVIVDDVLTSGNSLETCILALREEGIECAGCVILVDRGEGGREYIEKTYNIPVVSIYSRSDFVE